MFRSIRSRLVLWYTGIVVVTFMGAAVVIEQNLNHTLSETLDQSLTGEFQWISDRYAKFADGSLPADRVKQEIFDHGSYYFVKEYIDIYDSLGNNFFRTRNLDRDSLKNYIKRTDLHGFTLLTVEHFRQHNLRVGAQTLPNGTIYVAMPLTIVTLPINHILGIFVWIGPIVILISIVGGIYLANKSLGKVNSVIDAAKLLTVERLHDRLPEHDVQDEIGRLISTFNDMIARLDFSFGQMKQFSADASHELRTPLAVLRAQLEQALDENITLEDIREIVANCLDQTMHMSVLVEHLLLLAKADANQEVIQKQPVQLGKMIRDLFDESVMLASQRSIDVSVARIEDVRVLGEERRLRQMMLNLIDNAIKYNRTHGEISLSLERDDNMAKITVKDTGIGIPDHELGRIFDRFYRVDKARSKSSGGVGLGLSIVKWTVEAHGGRITVSSELHKGTSFTVFLPILVEG